MAIPVGTNLEQKELPVPSSADDLPLLYEDEEEGDMGEANIHVLTEEISRNGLKSHLAGQRRYRVFSNMNLYYHPKDLRAYVSPDTMLVEPSAAVEVSDERSSELLKPPEIAKSKCSFAVMASSSSVPMLRALGTLKITREEQDPAVTVAWRSLTSM